MSAEFASSYGISVGKTHACSSLVLEAEVMEAESIYQRGRSLEPTVMVKIHIQDGRTPFSQEVVEPSQGRAISTDGYVHAVKQLGNT